MGAQDGVACPAGSPYPPQIPKIRIVPALDRFTLTRHFAARAVFRRRPSLIMVEPLLTGSGTMLDRRQSTRDRVIFGGVAEIDEHGEKRDCVVRNISETGAHIEFSNVVRLPKEKLSLTIARKGRSFLAQGDLVARQFRRRRLLLGTTLRTSGLRSRGAAAPKRERKAPAAAPHQRAARPRLDASTHGHFLPPP